MKTNVNKFQDDTQGKDDAECRMQGVESRKCRKCRKCRKVFPGAGFGCIGKRRKV